jgi:hypothetical protein
VGYGNSSWPSVGWRGLAGALCGLYQSSASAMQLIVPRASDRARHEDVGLEPPAERQRNDVVYFFFSSAFCFAHRRFCARLIFRRAAADIVRRFRGCASLTAAVA